jgi:KipI family sensor histidine kinase inhibitor
MSLQTMGDTAYLVTFPGEADAALLLKVRAFAAGLVADRLEGVTEIVPAYGAVGVIYEPERVPTSHGELPWRVVGEWLERHLEGKAAAASRQARNPREHVVPVVYGGEHGPDLEAVAKHAKLSVAEVVKLHAGATYQVAALGFSPGFPYLLGLPEKLAMPRRTTPRLRVPAGSVGIGGAQTGVYPRETPGGWQLIGRTGLELFVPERLVEPSLLAAGDRVKFRAVEKLPPAPALPAADPDPGARALAAGMALGESFIEVVKPGTLTTVQDLGRRGFAALGVGVGGALDPWAAMVANLAVGNAPETPLLECTYVGPALRFSSTTIIAAVGAESSGLPAGRPVQVRAGEVVDCSALTRGARLYLAVAGGLRVPRVLGGAGTAVGARFGGFGGRPLEIGDRVPYGVASAPVAVGATWRLASPVPAPMRKDVIEVRLVPGPDWAQIFKRFGPGGAARALEARRFQLSAKSDRMGLRLTGEAFTLPGGAGEQVSRPVVPGTVQLPPDGLPIVLMGEGQTIGGYPQLGQVASVDLPKLAQARPGAEIVFKLTDVSGAQQARLRVAADVARLRVGLGMRR